MENEKMYPINGYSMEHLIREAKRGELFKFEVRNLLANLMRDWLEKYDNDYSVETEKSFDLLDKKIKDLFDALGHSAIY